MKTYTYNGIEYKNLEALRNCFPKISLPQYIKDADVVALGVEVLEIPDPEPTLDELKEAKCAQIRAESDARISLLEQGYTAGEVKTFEQQYSGATAIVTSNLSHEHALFVQDLLTVRLGRTPTPEEVVAFAQKIIYNYDTAKAYTVNILGTQQRLENEVRACTTAEEVEAIEWGDSNG